ETLVMVTTVVVVVATNNLAIGVAAGALLAMGLFARRIAHVTSVRRLVTDGAATYTVRGPLFFGSSNDLVEQFTYAEDPPQVTIDFSAAQIWDASTVAVLDSVQTKYSDHGIEVRFTGLDEHSTQFHGRLTGTLN
ncbi:MAG: STAS domain-containing protein, partial [Brachybacterium sp.]